MTSPAPLQTHRAQIRRETPKWLHGKIAGALLDAIAHEFDKLGDMAAQAVRRRFPIVGESDDAFGMIGRGRKIHRGPFESAASYAQRLRRWLDDHRTRGGPYAMLAQLFAFYSGAPVLIDLVYRSGRRFRMDLAGAVTRDDITWSPDAGDTWGDPGTWGDGGSWGVDSYRWAQWWMFHYLSSAIPLDTAWGTAGTWGDGYTWGTGLTQQVVDQYKLIPTEWNAAHAIGHLVLVSPDSELWGYPTGTWGDPGVWGGNTLQLDVG